MRNWAIVAVMLGYFGGGDLRADVGNLSGSWQGAVSREGSIQIMEIELRAQGDSLSGRYAIPEMGLYEEPLADIVVTDSTLQFHFLYGVFVMHRNDGLDQLTGRNDKWNPPVSLHLKKLAAPFKRPYESEPLTFVSQGVSLAGTFVRPASGGPYPVLVAIPGSGNQGRQTWEYRSHAYALAAQGVAVLLYDKRGVGESGGNLDLADFTLFAKDAAAALESARRRPDILPHAAGFLGISQGGWISAIASRLGANPDFIILLEGPSVSLEEQELDRVEYSMRSDDYSRAAIDSAVAHTREYFKFVKTSKNWKALSKSTKSASTAAWAEYVQRPTSPDDSDVSWWRRNAYDPKADLTRLQCPVLSIFGEIDTNVPPAENLELMKKYLTQAGVEFDITVIPQLPHSVTTFQTLKGGDWKWPDAFWVWCRRPVQLDSAMTTWVNARLRHP